VHLTYKGSFLVSLAASLYSLITSASTAVSGTSWEACWGISSLQLESIGRVQPQPPPLTLIIPSHACIKTRPAATAHHHHASLLKSSIKQVACFGAWTATAQVMRISSLNNGEEAINLYHNICWYSWRLHNDDYSNCYESGTEHPVHNFYMS
jgi:hypothetical protein